MASSVIGALRVVLGIDTAMFDKGLADATKTLKGVGKNMQSVGKSMSMYLTAPLAGFGALTVKTAGDFEASMNRVQAATSASAAEIEAMRKLAIDLGQDTSKSASESADMMEMLAKNGLNATQILDGAAAASIKLSEATGGDLSKSADVATNVMAQFKVEAKDLGKVVDGITGVTLASQFGFDDYALAIAQAGGVAGGLGVTLDDFNATIAATSSVFASGSDAGTSYKTFLTTLVPKSKKAAVAMEELGLKFFNADGSMKSMADIAENLKTSLSGLSDEAKTNALSEIFGADAMRTAIALADQGAAGVNTFRDAVTKSGIADEQAAARMKGFNGELEKLGGAFETLQLAIANSGLLAFVTSMVTKLADFIEALSETNPELLKWGTVIAGVVAIAGPVIAALGFMVTGFVALAPAIGVVVAALGALLTPIGLVVAALAGIAAAWAYWDEIKAQFPTFAAVVETSLAGLQTLLVGFGEHFKLLFTGIYQLLTGDFSGAWETAKAIVQNFVDTFMSFATTMFPSAVEAITSRVAGIVEAFSRIGPEILAVFRALPAQMIQIGSDIIDGLWQGIKNKWESVKAGVSNIASGIKDTFTGFFQIHSPSKVMETIGTNIMQGLGNGMDSLKGNVVGTAGTVSSSISSAFSGLESIGSSLGDAIKGTKDWSDVLADVAKQIGKLALSKIDFGGGGFGGIISGLFGSLLGFASGGTIMPGGAGGIDSQVVAFRKSPNERVDITKPGQTLTSDGGRRGDTYNIDARGADAAAVTRLERGLQERDRVFTKRVDSRVDTRNTRGTRA